MVASFASVLAVEADVALPIKLFAFILPVTSSFSVGDCVPIPTLPPAIDSVFVPCPKRSRRWELKI